MRVHFEISLFLLPAFLLTSDILLVTAQPSTKKPRSSKPTTTTTFTLTPCAKSCRSEFFQYCRTREAVVKAGGKTEAEAGDAFRRCMCVDRSGVQYVEHCARRCNLDGGVPEQVGEIRAWWGGWCEKHQPTLTATTISVPSPKTPESADAELDGKVPGMSLVAIDSGSSDSTTPSSTPQPANDDKQQQQTSPPHSVNIYAAGASLTFASAFIFISYLTLLRRSKYARRRGILPWLRLYLLERGYRRSGGGGAGLPHSRTRNGQKATAMRLRVATGGKMEVVGNPRWLNKSVPPLPVPLGFPHHPIVNTRGGNSGQHRIADDTSRNTTVAPGFLSRMMGRRGSGAGGGQEYSPAFTKGSSSISKTQNISSRKSHRYSQGWISAAKRYTDEAEQEDEKVVDYFRSKGIARSGVYAGVSSTGEGEGDRDAVLTEVVVGGAEDGVDVDVDHGKLYAEGGLNIADVEEEEMEMETEDTLAEEEEEEGEHQNQLVHEQAGVMDNAMPVGLGIRTTTFNDNRPSFDDDDDDNYGINERSSRLSPPSRSASRHSTSSDSEYAILADISATPHLHSEQWDSLTGTEGAQIDATGGLRSGSSVQPPGSGGYGYGYGGGGISFEEVDLIGRDSSDSYGGYGWAAAAAGGHGHPNQDLQQPQSASAAGALAMGSNGYNPIIVPDPQHGKRESDGGGDKHRPMKSRLKWRALGGKGTKVLSMAFRGKRGSGGGGSGAYGTI